MQKYKNITTLILFVLCIYFLFSQFYLLRYGNIYTYIINPIFFIVLALVLKYTIASPYKTDKYKKTIIQYTLITMLSYAFLLLISGLFLTYGNNPYSNTLKGILLNLYSTGTVIVCREYIRYKLINNVYKKDRNFIFVAIVIVFTMADIDFYTLVNSINIYYLFKVIFNNIIPSVIKNSLFTYICIYVDYVPSVVYELLLYLLLWIPPVLPNTPWVFDAIINSVFPLILLLYCKYEIASKDKMHLYKYSNPVEPRGLIPLVISIVLIIWFALGIFPIKPIGIASGSMSPNIKVGDMVIIRKCNANDIQVNDVIEYTKDEYSIIHRVIEKYQVDGEFFFITKGDSNESRDKEPVSEKQLKGKVIGRVPYVAYPTIWLNILSGRQVQTEI